MKHNSFQTLTTLYNLVKIGGHKLYLDVDTRNDNYKDERQEFIRLVRTHGYDILSSDDFMYEEKMNEYNRVLELKAKSENFDCYDKLICDEICVCGQWIFTNKEFCGHKEETKVADIRGGHRTGAGRKPKNPELISTKTVVIRVPELHKQEIKTLIDWLVSKATQGEDVISALHSSINALEYKAEELNRQTSTGAVTEQAEKCEEEAKIIKDMCSVLPRFFTKKK